MVSKKLASGRGTRAHNQAMIRIGGEQGRAVVSGNFSTCASARCLFGVAMAGLPIRMENQA